MEKKIKVMMDEGFVGRDYKGSKVEVEKKYKCYLSKKCNDEKFERIKKMFEYVRNDDEFMKFMGSSEYGKLLESYGKKEKRGEVVKVNYDGMDIMEIFKKYKMGVKEVCKKGYIVENDIYKKK